MRVASAQQHHVRCNHRWCVEFDPPVHRDNALLRLVGGEVSFAFTACPSNAKTAMTTRNARDLLEQLLHRTFV